MVRTLSLGLLVVLTLLSFGCSSMPQASNENETLLVLVNDGISDTLELSGPNGTRRFEFPDERLLIQAVEPGRYSANGGDAVEVPPAAVMLFPQAVDSGRSVGPADQMRAMDILTSYVGFDSWFGREYLNFGPFRPKQYLSGEYFELKIEAEPAGSLVIIDESVWGETPLSIELTEGKYLLEVAAPGYRSFKRIIDVDRDLALRPGLEALPADTEEEQDSFDIMIAPIRALSDEGDPYGEVIASTMRVNFDSDPRLSASLARDTGVKEYPDFGPAEEAGADLLVAGNYRVEGNELYLEMVLYEATTRRIKFAETYLSEAGFAVFDSIDQVAASFASAVSRTLPEPGERIVEREVSATADLVSYERSIYRKRMIASRLEKRNLVSAKIAIGGLNDEVEIGNTGENIHSGGEGVPLNIFRLDYQRIMGQWLSFSSSLTVMLQGVDADNGISEGPDMVPSFGLFLGPEFAFRSETSDVYFTPSLLLGFAPPYSVTTSQEYDIDARYYTGLELDVGYRYYFFRRRGDRPIFLNLGMYFDMIEFAFTPGSDFGIVPLRGGLYLGGGTAL